MERERYRAVLTDPDRVLGTHAERLSVDSTIADGKYHPGLDALEFLLAVDHRVAAGNRRLLVFDADAVEHRTQEVAAKAAALQHAGHRAIDPEQRRIGNGRRSE